MQQQPSLKHLVQLVGTLSSDISSWETSSNGDCLFHSICIILESDEELFPFSPSITLLRQMVANSFSVIDELTRQTLWSWIEVYNGAKKERNLPLMLEYFHIANVCAIENQTNYLKNHNQLSQEQLHCLQKCILQNKFWGEEHSIRILSNILGVHFWIIDADTNLVQKTYHHNLNSKWFAILLRSNNHYEPLSIDDRFLWSTALLGRRLHH